MRKGHFCVRHQLLDFQGSPGNVIDPVVDIIDLAPAGEFPHDCLAHQLFIVLHDIGLDRHAVHRRLFQDAHVPDPHHTHMECARNRSCGKSQDIHILLHLLDFFLVGDTEALFLVHDQQTQIFELDILGEKPVCTDDDIHHAPLQVVDRFFLLLGASEPGEHFNVDRKAVHSLREGVVVLLGQDGGRHQNSHLHSLLYCLEGSAHGDLCLAVPHVAADQAVHDPSALHIPLCIFDRRQLILCLLEGEHFLKLVLPDCIFPIDMSFSGLAFCIQFDQVVRDHLHGLLDLSAGIAPLLRPQFIELGLAGALCRSVFLQDRQICGHDKKYAACAVLDLQVIPGNMIDFYFFNTPVNADPVVLMDNIISDAKFREIADLLSAVISSDPLFLLFLLSENIGFSEDRKSQLRIGKAPAHPARVCHDIPGL